ncbi:MAG: hypothetical protein L0Z50_34790 [Verrucomicrobiales bacterium]|nr:hypothetical protein [Verrucomicrobiales bacterium]
MGQIFLLSTGVILSLTAGAKLLSAFGDTKILDFPDPLWGLSNRRLLFGAALLEFASVLCFLGRMRVELKYLLSAWLGANFILYRAANAVLNPGKPCPCLGTASERIHLSEETASYLLSALAVYMLFAGVALYVQRSRSSATSAASTKPA